MNKNELENREETLTEYMHRTARNMAEMRQAGPTISYRNDAMRRRAEGGDSTCWTDDGTDD